MRRRRGRRWPRRHPGAAARETTRVVEARAAERHNDVVMAATRGFHIWRSAAVSIHVCAVIVAAIQGEGAIGARHAGEQVDAQHSRDLEKVLRRRFWPQLQRRDHGDARLVDGAVHAIIHVLRRVLEVASQCGACRLRVHLRLEQRMPVAVGARRARGELGAVGGRAAATTALDDVKQLAYDEVGVVPVDDCRYDGELAEDAQHVLHLVGVLAVEERLVVVEVALVACEPAKAAGAAEMILVRLGSLHWVAENHHKRHLAQALCAVACPDEAEEPSALVDVVVGVVEHVVGRRIEGDHTRSAAVPAEAIRPVHDAGSVAVAVRPIKEVRLL